MSSMQIEVTTSSSPFNYVSLRDHNRPTNNKGYIHPQSSRKNNADDGNQKTDNYWLPTSSLNSTVTSDTEDSNHGNHNTVVNDDSWLPTVNDSNAKYGTNMKELEDDTDYSWLPSSFIDNNLNNNNNDNNNKNKNRNTNKNSPQKKSRNGHWALARDINFSCDQQNQNEQTNILTKRSHSSWIQQDFPSKSTCVVESPNSGGVSSLLQRWRDLTDAKNSNNLGSTCIEGKNDNSPSTPQKTVNDSDSEWEYNKVSTHLSCTLPRHDRKDPNPGSAQKEKIRVLDIINNLSHEEELDASHATGHGSDSLPQIHTALHKEQTKGGHIGIKSSKVSSHLIRGRQAFDKFLKQIEHHKHYELKCLVEHKAVSKFSHRGRIQASLRFKILRLGSEPKTETKNHRPCISKTLESNNRLDIMDQREMFNHGVEKGAPESKKTTRNDTKIPSKEGTSATTATREVDVKIQSETKKQEHQPSIAPLTSNHSTKCSTWFVNDAVHKAKFVDSSSNSIMFKEDKHSIYEDKFDFNEDEGQFMSAKTSYGEIENRGFSDSSEETNYTDNKQASETFNDWETDIYSETSSDLDGEESTDMQLFNTNYNWVGEISRPKSDWEYMRQARYQEMLHDHSPRNGDIQHLLERKSVSRFLESGLRELMDQLMVNRIEQSHLQVEKKDTIIVKEKLAISPKEMAQEDSYMVDEDVDCRSQTETKCSQYSECVDQTTYSEQSWKPNDVVDNSPTTSTTSPYFEQSLSSNRSHNNSTAQSPLPITHQTIEMELIYDLRRHMEQLHQELMEVRTSIRSCINMQVKMQHSFNQNAIVAMTNPPVQNTETKLPGLVKHNCSICHVVQVDSLLYRCGHMCTCFSCALEIQHACGECPVCEAPIVDVVKAFAYEN